MTKHFVSTSLTQTCTITKELFPNQSLDRTINIECAKRIPRARQSIHLNYMHLLYTYMLLLKHIVHSFLISQF